MRDKELKALINTIKLTAGQKMRCLSVKVERTITEYADFSDIYIYAEHVDDSSLSHYYSLDMWIGFSDVSVDM